ncbi:hypothetical protein LNP25_24765 [Klebsiella variicola subsp. variicola]|nr:hypothetical protein [Klebsiella variicola subsp. variicola]
MKPAPVASSCCSAGGAPRTAPRSLRDPRGVKAQGVCAVTTSRRLIAQKREKNIKGYHHSWWMND